MMSYQALALKYRPKNFDEFIGQNYVVKALKNAIKSGRVHHAYLFSGPRGIGKTSMARVLAKSLNCEKGPTVNPCGKCVSCSEIEKGNSLDIIEIDAASNRGIDEIRTLRENVKLMTSHARFKIYIIDEVHMLTQEAFNALLKTLEEPPSHVKFIFATTHPHKVLPTILSRCQNFQFNLLPLEKIVDKLKKIAKAEKFKIDDNTVYTIARACGGSIRDAESLLDQLVPVILEEGQVKDVFSFLGIIEETTVNKMVSFLVEGKLPEALNLIGSLAGEGKDLSIFTDTLIEHLRHLLLAGVNESNFSRLVDISPDSKDFLIKSSKDIPLKEVLKAVDLLIEAKDLSRRLNTIRIPLELAMVKLLNKNNNLSEPVPRGEERKNHHKISSRDSGKNVNPKKKDEKAVVEPDDNDYDIDLTEKSDGQKEPDCPVKEEEPIAADDVLYLSLNPKWQDVLSNMQNERAALASHLAFAKPVSSKGNLIIIGFLPRDKFHKEIAESTKNSTFIRDSISKVLGKDIRVKFVIEGSVDAPAQNTPKKKKKLQRDEINDNQFVNDVLETFGGDFYSEND
ncbi:MAG: DNA polymerase III subunit gamma/tau [Candidatus Omnitrophica bacterium]|nr:DNA polymerase III subunit gamma/tau [Candidatus Omnitrophota bacterium]MBD3269371.1 DNA polymerase III subunit gamma/tau [Candidatus Omnitrophota bacterium]